MKDVLVAPVVPPDGQIIIDSKTLEQCLKSALSFGYTTYYNVCTGAEFVIPWGGADWALAIFLIVLGVGVIVGGAAFTYMMLSDL